jgi:hypothetical protein
MAIAWKWNLGKMSIVLLLGASLFLFYPFFFRKAYLHYLLDCLQSHDLKTVLNGIQALGERDHRQAVSVLLQLLEATDTMAVKRNIVLSLGRMQAEKALPKVIEQFSIPEESVQLSVLESLSLYRNYESLFALYEFMRSQENVSFQVRMNATYLMTRLVGKRKPLQRGLKRRGFPYQGQCPRIDRFAEGAQHDIVRAPLPSTHEPPATGQCRHLPFSFPPREK